MVHAQNLPADAVRFRLGIEQRIVADWLNSVPATASVLDAGCGAGTWTRIFASRYAHVVGIEGSRSMAEAAREQTRDQANVEILEGDIKADVPDQSFRLAFFGGLMMYLNDEDVVDLLKNIRTRADGDLTIILRESTVSAERESASGEYQALYRTVDEYHALFRRAGFSQIETRRNHGYTAMEIAVELVEARRRWLAFLPKASPVLGAATWWCLRLNAPLSFWALPRVLDALGIRWPRLQNHFFCLSERTPERAVASGKPSSQ
jgi:SAM-dependent methyltransferase